MKNAGLILLTSLLSAILAIAGYRYFAEPQQVIVRESVTPVKYTHFDEEDAFDAAVNRKSPSLPSFPSAAPTHFTAAAEIVRPAVVNIKALESKRYDWWGSGSYGTSSGSGVIVSSNGYIVTNNHVIEDGDEFSVTLNDKREFEAKLVGIDPSTDLAVLKVEAEGLPFLQFGNSDSLKVGEWVLAVGNPFNLESTVTAGIVSAKGRNIDILEGEYSIESFIQTDAAVNPGNSGGALVNTNGDLVGINTAIITRSGRYEGYSFAVPSNLVQKVIRDLRDFGSVQRGILGVGIGEITSRQARQLGLNSVEGVYITRVTPNSGADEAGIKRGDVIIGIDDIKVRTVPELQEIVARYRPGNNLKIEYIRNGKTKTTNVILRNQFNTSEVPTNATESDFLKNLGFELRNLSRDEVRQIGIDGVYVVSIMRGSTIEETQMDPGYIITHVNDIRVNTLDDVLGELQGSKGQVTLTGVYEDYPDEYYYIFDPN